MLDHSHRWVSPCADIDAERRASFEAYLRANLADVQAKRRLPQTRSDHQSLADREAHYRRLIARMQ